LQGEPFLMYNKTEENPQGNDRYMGYSMDLLKEISNVLGIDFEFNLVPSNKHDDLVNELVARVRVSATAMLSLCARDGHHVLTRNSCCMLQRADLAICDLTITQEREQMIDFTMPFMNLGE
jgi:ABC-type amino acid transport substrate-binding protein